MAVFVNGKEIRGLTDGVLVNYHLLRAFRALYPIYSDFHSLDLHLSRARFWMSAGQGWLDGDEASVWSIVDAVSRKPMGKKTFVRFDEFLKPNWDNIWWINNQPRRRTSAWIMEKAMFSWVFAVMSVQDWTYLPIQNPHFLLDEGSKSGPIRFSRMRPNGIESWFIKLGSENHLARTRKGKMGRSLPKTKVAEKILDMEARLPEYDL